MSSLQLDHPGVQQALNECSRRWGKPRFQEDLLHNLDFCEELLLSLEGQPLPCQTRQELYAALIGPGPAGLRAFAWMLQQQLLDATTARAYLDCLQPGPPRVGALEAEEVAPLVEHLQPLLPEQPWAQRLLGSNALSLKARRWWLREFLSRPGESSLALSRWALAAEAPRELQREAMQLAIANGRSPAHLLEELLDPPSPLILELVEHYPDELPPHLRLRAMMAFRNSSNSAWRRRAFQLLEKHEGPDWVHQGLRDSDAGVRNWAMQQRKHGGDSWKNSN